MSSFGEQAKKAFPAEIHMISCQTQNQDAAFANVGPYELPAPYHGMCSAAMVRALWTDQLRTTPENVTWIDLLKRMRAHMEEQGVNGCLPQLTSTRPLQVQQPLTIVPAKMGSNSEKRAVLIGINYVGQSNALKNSHHDVKNMSNYLIKVLGFQQRNVVILMDDGLRQEPTRQNILRNLTQICDRSKAGDVAFIHYSGHGGRWRDGDDDKSAGYDETLIPVDVRTAGHIRDDELYKNLLCAMPAGVHTTIVMDSRHSVMRLPYKMDAPGQEEGTMQMSEIGGYAFHGLIGLAAIGTVTVAVGGGVLASNAVGSGGGGGGNWGCCNDIFGSIFGDN